MRVTPARRRGLALLLTALLAAPAFAAEPAGSDAALTAKVRAVLAADRELAGLNVTVSVVDRVAVIGGPVTSPDAPARIEAAVRKVPGLSAVKVTCWSPFAEDPLKALVGERLKADPLPPLAITPRPEPEPIPVPPLAALPRPVDRRPVGTVTVQRIATPPALAGLLLDPVAPGGAAVTPLPMPARSADATIPAPDVPTVPLSFPDAVALLRKAPRFAGLTAELRGGTATIGGRADRHADAWDFAAAVRKLPGVERVVLGEVAVR